mmetsp:Transcript_32571/g.69365  ORF Transcript_32571/g.69365 Transcript_32571/m.69365 type:complete len:474 (+) Transcript_32571:601-2022(+)
MPPTSATLATASSRLRWAIVIFRRMQHARSWIFRWPGKRCMHSTTQSRRLLPRLRTPLSSRKTFTAPRRPCGARRSPMGRTRRNCSSQKRRPTSRSWRSFASQSASKSSAVPMSRASFPCVAHFSVARQPTAASPTASSLQLPRASKQSGTAPHSMMQRAPGGFFRASARSAPRASRCTSLSSLWPCSAETSASAPPSWSASACWLRRARRWPPQSSRKAPQQAACSSAFSMWKAKAFASSSKPPHSVMRWRWPGLRANLNKATDACAATSSPKAKRPTTSAAACMSSGFRVFRNHVASSTVLYVGLLVKSASATAKCPARYCSAPSRQAKLWRYKASAFSVLPAVSWARASSSRANLQLSSCACRQVSSSSLPDLRVPPKPSLGGEAAPRCAVAASIARVFASVKSPFSKRAIASASCSSPHSEPALATIASTNAAPSPMASEPALGSPAAVAAKRPPRRWAPIPREGAKGP